MWCKDQYTSSPKGRNNTAQGNALGNGADAQITLCDTLAHYPLFADCLTGPESEADPACACPDDDADSDVDLADFARFQRTFVGP